MSGYQAGDIMCVICVFSFGEDRLCKWQRPKNLKELYNISLYLFKMIDCQVKCNKINEKIYKALRGEYENQGVYGDDY